LIKVAAELRTLGKSWETVAAGVGRSVRTVSGWSRSYPEEWRQAHRNAEEQLVVEAAAESVLVLRNLLRSEDDKVRRDAAHQLLDFRLELAKLEGKASAVKKPASVEAERLANFLSERDDKQLNELIDRLCARRAVDRPQGPQ
jgi:hypothetical protein